MLRNLILAVMLAMPMTAIAQIQPRQQTVEGAYRQVADLTALKSLGSAPQDKIRDNERVYVRSNEQTYVYHAADTTSADNGYGVLASTGGLPGRWKTIELPIVVGSIAEMKALNRSDLANRVIRVKGEQEDFRYDPASVVTAEEGIVFAPDTLPGRFLRQVAGRPVRLDWWPDAADDSSRLLFACNAAMATTGELIVPAGDYSAGGLTLTGTGVESIVIRGAGTGKTNIQLRADPGGLTATDHLLHFLDFRNIRIEGISFDANPTASFGGTGNHGLLEYRHTIDDGRKEGVVHIQDCEFYGVAGGKDTLAHQLHIRSYEDVDSNTEIKQVVIARCQFRENGNTGGALRFRGPMGAVVVRDSHFQNDGAQGFEGYGGSTYNGSNVTAINASTELAWGNPIRSLHIHDCTFFRTTGTFAMMTRNYLVEDCEYIETARNPYYDVASATTTPDAGADTFTGNIPVSYRSEGMIQISSTGTLPTGITAGRTYHVRNANGTTFQIATTALGTPLNFTDNGTGTISYAIIGGTITTAAKTDDCVHTEADPAVIRYARVRYLDSSPHANQRSISHEESVPGTIGPVVIQDVHADKQVLVSGTKGYSVYDGCHFVVNADAALTNNNSQVRQGRIESCTFDSLPQFSLGPLDVKISQCNFRKGIAITPTGTGPHVVSISDSLFGEGFTSGEALIDVAGVSAGESTRLELVRNRPHPDSGAAFRFRSLDSVEKTAITVITKDNEMGIATFGNADDADYPIFETIGKSRTRSTKFYASSGTNETEQMSIGFGQVNLLAAAINHRQASIASASTMSIGTATANYLTVTGITDIASLGVATAGTRRTLEFVGELTLQHNDDGGAGGIILLPNSVDIRTQSGDVAEFVSLGNDDWKCVSYQPASLSYTVAWGASQTNLDVAGYHNHAVIHVTSATSELLRTITGGFSGQEITVVIGDANIGVQASTGFVLDSTDGTYTAQAGGAVFRFTCEDGPTNVWTESARRVVR